MQTDVQMLKMYGHLPSVELKDCAKESAKASVNDDAYAALIGRSCMCPDFADHELADTSEGWVAHHLGISEAQAVVIKEMHRRAELYNNQKWPRDCHGTGIHTTKVYWNWDSFERHASHIMRPCTEAELQSIVDARVWGMDLTEVRDRFSSMDMPRVAQWLADEAFRVLGQQHLQIDDGPQGQEHQIHVECEPIPGSVAGYAYLPDGSCSDHVNMRLDNLNWGLVTLTSVTAHEYGHTHGEQHQFHRQDWHRGVMSYNRPRDKFEGFSTGQAPHSLPRDPSRDSLDEKYTGESVPRPGDVDPDPPPKPGREVLLSTSYVDRGEQVDVMITRGKNDDHIVWG